jgi:hypothetical protein
MLDWIVRWPNGGHWISQSRDKPPESFLPAWFGVIVTLIASDSPNATAWQADGYLVRATREQHNFLDATITFFYSRATPPAMLGL